MTANAKLLALVTDAFGGRGGIAQYNRDFLTALAETRAFSAITVVPRHAPDVDRPGRGAGRGISQVRSRRGRLSYTYAAVNAARAVRPQVVFCGHLYIAPLARLIASAFGARLIVQVHGIEAWDRPSAVQRAALEAADLVLSVSRHTRQAVLSWAAIAPDKVVVLSPTMAPDFTPGPGDAIRGALGIDDAQVLLTVGRLAASERYKGHDRVIEALAKLEPAARKVVYVIVGEGDDSKRLEALAQKLGVAPQVRFAGSADHHRLVEFYRGADLFVMPSTGEGFGIAFIEAMACGTPALGLNVAGASDALADGQLGTLVREDALITAIADKLSQGVADRARTAAAVRDRFGAKKFSDRVRGIVMRFSEAA